jgi:tight adherence protein B
MSEFLFFLLPAAGAMLLFYGIFQAVVDARGREKNKIISRLQERSGGGGGAASRDKKIRESLLRHSEQTQDNPIFALVAKLSIVPKIQGMLDQANVDMAASKFLSYLMGASEASMPVIMVVGLGPLVAAAAAACILILPLIWLKWTRSRRMFKLINQLPDVFEMMGQSLRAGHSLAGAIHLIAEQLPDPAGTEFARVFHEQNLGLRVEDSLLNLATRCDQMDIRFFVTAVLIQRQTGGDLAEVLDNISGIIRGRIELFGQVKGLTAEGRMSGWVLLSLPVVVFFVSLYMNPKYTMTLIDEPRGRMMLCVAGMMQLMGMAMIKKIVSIKV